MTTDEWYGGRYWQEEFPEATYEAYRPKTGSPSFLDYLLGNKSQVLSEFQGALAQQARVGQSPSLSIVDFLGGSETQSPYPWLQNWLRMSPSQRGVQLGWYAPRTRWNV